MMSSSTEWKNSTWKICEHQGNTVSLLLPRLRPSKDHRMSHRGDNTIGDSLSGDLQRCVTYFTHGERDDVRIY